MSGDHVAAEPVIDHIASILLDETERLLGARAGHEPIALKEWDRLFAREPPFQKIARDREPGAGELVGRRLQRQISSRFPRRQAGKRVENARLELQPLV